MQLSVAAAQGLINPDNNPNSEIGLNGEPDFKAVTNLNPKT